MRLPLLMWTVLTAVLGLGLAPARAEQVPARRVALILEPARKADAARVSQLTNLLLAAFQKRGVQRARLVLPYDPTALAAGREALATVRKAINADHRMLRAAEHEAGLTRALLGLKSGLGSVSLKELVEVHLGLASTRLAAEDRRLGTIYMRAALNMKPDLTGRDFFGAEALRSLFRTVKASSIGVGKIRVETRPKGAEVYVGDRLAGYSPLTLEGLATGTQLIRVRSDGFFTHGWLADVRAQQTQKLSLVLKPVAGRSKLKRLVATLGKTRQWAKRPEAMKTAAEALKGLLAATDAVIFRVKRTRTAYELVGAVAPMGKPPKPVKLTLKVDGGLLKRVDVLTYEWVP